MSIKNLVIHITEGEASKLRSKLHENELFSTHYDGWEMSKSTVDGRIMSTRYYYYGIPHDKVLGMLKALRRHGEEYTYKIKILPKGVGQVNFD